MRKLFILLLVGVAIPFLAKSTTINNHFNEVPPKEEIALTQKEYKDSIPPSVQQWMEKEIAGAKRKDLVDFKSDSFFSDTPAILIGYIKGYDRDLDISTSMLYITNEITRENLPTVVNIQPDGRFEVEVQIVNPQMMYIAFENKFITFYLEPEHTLSMVLDWQEFITDKKQGNGQLPFKDLEFGGSLAKVNEDLLFVQNKLKEPPFMKAYSQEAANIEPLEYKATQDEFVKSYREGLQDLIKNKEIGERAATILTIDLVIREASYLFEYLENYKSAHNDKEIPLEFYDFLQKVPFDDHRIMLSAKFSIFINRFEYNDKFRSIYNSIYQIMRERETPSITVEEYLFDELGLEKSESDITLSEMNASMDNIMLGEGSSEEEKNAFKAKLEELETVFDEKYEDLIDEYYEKYVAPLVINRAQEQSLRWDFQDSIQTNVFKLQKGFVSDIVKTRTMNFLFEGSRKEDATELLSVYNSYVTNPFMKQEAQRLYDNAFIKTNIAYELPEGRGGDIVRKIIAPFKGKYIFIDFWATWCGPCVGGIKMMKETREEYKNHPEVEFLFISDEEPSDRYTKFVEEQDMTNHFNVSEDDFRYLRQLFKFNGIPRYVFINKEGLVENDNYSMHNFNNHIKELLKDTNEN